MRTICHHTTENDPSRNPLDMLVLDPRSRIVLMIDGERILDITAAAYVLTQSMIDESYTSGRTPDGRPLIAMDNDSAGLERPFTLRMVAALPSIRTSVYFEKDENEA